MTPKRRIETARTKEKKGPTKTITEGEMAEFAKDAENSRTLENNARQRTQTAIFAGFRGTGHELARKKGKIETTTTEAEGRRGIRAPQLLSPTGGGGLTRVWGAGDSAELLSMESLKTSLLNHEST